MFHRLQSLRKLSPARGRRTISTFGYTQAKALVYSDYGEPSERLKLHTYSIPPAHGKAVTIRYLASPINPADINQIQGTYKALPPFTQSLGTSQPSAVPGNEGVAEVISAGASVESLRKGDWVVPRFTGLGTWRTHDQIDADRVFRVNSTGLSPVQVATVSINPCTAYRLLDGFVKLAQGEWFIQNGANSAVGRAAIQLARLRGLKSINIIRTRPEDELAALKNELTELGATQILTEEEMEGKAIKERLRHLTGGLLPKLAFDCTGGSSGTKLISALAEGGTHVTYGNMAKKPLRVGAGHLIFNNISVRGLWISRWAEENPEAKMEMVNRLLDMMRSGLLKNQKLQEVAWSNSTSERSLVEVVDRYHNHGGKSTFIFEG